MLLGDHARRFMPRERFGSVGTTPLICKQKGPESTSYSYSQHGSAGPCSGPIDEPGSCQA
eukprot:11590133-Karenia_brevis.AAC.1